MSLEMHGLWKGFADASGRGKPHWVLRDVELTVSPGEFVSLIGHSGCGKSTLLNVLAGLSTADAGSVTLDGRPITSPGPDRTMVFQNYSLLSSLSLLDNVIVAVKSAGGRGRTPAVSRNAAGERAERYLTAVGLWEHRTKRPHQVSGGMQQRCAVARAFSVEPRVLLLDEPFGALDALTRGRLQEQLIDLWRSESNTEIVVMVTHAIEEATLLSDRIVMMGTGEGPSVVDTIAVDIPRPRSADLMLVNPTARAVHERLVSLLHHGYSDQEDAA